MRNVFNVIKINEILNQLRQLLKKAILRRPQLFRQNKEKVPVLPDSQQKISDFFKHSPLSKVEIDLSRNKDSISKDVKL